MTKAAAVGHTPAADLCIGSGTAAHVLCELSKKSIFSVFWAVFLVAGRAPRIIVAVVHDPSCMTRSVRHRLLLVVALIAV
ncbi:MAG: hypothetical protein AAGC55_06030, partial [Myxococcota bacterium]